MRIIGLHHVAFGHRSEDPTVGALQALLGLEASHVEPGDGFVERMFPIGPDSVCLQTLEATGRGVVERFVQHRGAALHHVAFEVPGLESALRELQEKGARLIDDSPRPGGGDTQIAFVHPSTFGGLLVELVESPAGN